MIVELVTPAPRGSRKGNRITALRWAKIFRRLGHRTVVTTEHTENARDTADLVISLHAKRGWTALDAAKREHPDRPVIVALTGTDLYVDGVTDPTVMDSLTRADRLVVLQPRAIDALPPDVRQKARTIRQSCAPPSHDRRPREDVFEVVVAGHMRAVKDPMLAATAARLLPASSRVAVTQIGEALTPEFADRARREEEANPRYRWIGPRHRRETLERIATARLLVLTSRAEGGAQVISEALACGTSVLATRIDGVVGLLGDDWPGLFPVGDATVLARLLERIETDPDARDRLAKRTEALAPLYRPATEVEAWRALLGEFA